MKKIAELPKHENPIFGVHNIGNIFSSNTIELYYYYDSDKRENGKTMVYASKGDSKRLPFFDRKRGYLGEHFFFSLQEAKKAVKDKIDKKILALKKIHEAQLERLNDIIKNLGSIPDSL
jgi:hypothetical protein